MKRKQLALPREFYEKSKEFDKETKHQVQDAIFDHFFDGVPIEYDKYPDTVRIALACLLPDLRRLQTQFENGSCEKKLRQNTQGLLCPKNGSQIKPNEANGSQRGASILNSNNIYNNINSQINSNQSNSKNETTPNNTCCDGGNLESDIKKREFFAEVLKQQLERIQELDPQTHQKMLALVQNVAAATVPFKIKNTLVLPEQVLEQYLDFFRRDSNVEIAEQLNQVIARTDTVQTNNRKKYLVSALYNEARINLT